MTDVRELIAQGAQVPLVPPPGEDPLEAQLAELRTNDPPGFFLQASPTYQGGVLPDGVWQRVPIGGTGQVLTVQADGSVNWQNSSTGFANPMTTAGDVMYENASPAPARLAIGTAGQVLTVVGGFPAWAVPVTGFTNPMNALGDLITGSSGGGAVRLGVGTAGQVLTVSGGVPVWQNSAAGFTNPMTTAGDIIFENAVPAPARLAIGTAGQVLTVSGGVPTWQNSAAGFSNPMTTVGDIITATGGGAAQRLAAGSAGQVLGISAGVPAWINSPAGFANPMTSVGDMITGTTGGAAARLPVGTASQMLQVNTAGTTPVWATMPFIVVPPSGDVTGVTDQANFNAAFAALPNGGTVQMLPGTYYLPPSGISLPPYNNWVGCGHGTVINCVGGGTGTYITQFNSANPQTYTRLSSQLIDFIVDGTAAGNGAIGVSLQDVNNENLRIAVRNFTGTGSVGVQIANNTHSLNVLTGVVRVENCTNCLQFNVVGAMNQTAIEHIYVAWNLVVNSGQNAIVLANSVGIQGSDMIVDVGVLSNTAGPIITFGTGCIFTDTRFLLKAELNAAAGTVSTVSFNGVGSGFQRTTGILFFGSHILPSNIGSANGTVAHFGTIINDSTMQAAAIPPVGLGTYDASVITTPTFPVATGMPVTNNTGVPAWVTVSGGTLNAATVINAVNVGDTNTRVFMVPRGQTITLNWSVSPTGWVWQPVG